ncbi:flagellin lysine-N-methylase [Lachnobacterium bovis]|uniref:Lysine-N-methylase n=1 Tax=Lachnobacterium bovis TaxID=140626 RepID=A0A1H9T6B7_9FIRM|nr:flagellin lysine-N-methylase [Lachnobacterium bovis]SER92524.1 hypothetical protein SAMN02910429_01498 [Lachnobacterium bovis]
MKHLNMDIYTDFECVGKECKFTCCAGWEITIDDETFKIYDNLQGEFGEKIRKNITNENGCNMFVLNKEKKCPFFTAEGLCEIYLKLGPDKMCNTCQAYPRTCKRYGDMYFWSMYIDCPHILDMLIDKKDIILYELSESSNNVAGDSYDESKIDWQKFNNYIDAFVIINDIITNRAETIQNRMKLVVFFVKQFDELEETEKVQELLEFFRDKNNCKEFISELDGVCYSAEKEKVFLETIFNNDSIIDEFFKNGVRMQYQNALLKNKEDSLQVSNLLEKVAQIAMFKYFMDGFDNGNLKESFSYAIILYKVIEYTIRFYYITSGFFDKESIIESIVKEARGLEHTYLKRYKVALEKLKENNIYDYDSLLEIL